MRNYVVKTNGVKDATPLAAFLEPWLWGHSTDLRGTLPVEILDGEHETVIKAELPGVGKENIEVRYRDNTLTIEANKKIEVQEEEGPKTVRNERFAGKLERSFRLPFPIDFENASAQYVDGLLTLKLPKAAKSSHTITIQ